MQLNLNSFYFLRHGETDWNRERRVQGRMNRPLSARGLTQARRAGEMLRGKGIQTICTSPLDRALISAEIIAAQIHVPIVVIDGLKECGFGVQEGSVKGVWYEAWRRGITPEGAECFGAFLDRALDGLNQALDRPGPVLIVSHGGVYWAIEKFAGIERGGDIPNGVPLRHDPPRVPLLPWHAEALAA